LFGNSNIEGRIIARERACEEINDLILRSRAKRGVSKDGCTVATRFHPARRALRALLRMRLRLFHTLESGRSGNHVIFGWNAVQCFWDTGRPPFAGMTARDLLVS
jgi:hypothetical protein